MSITQVLVGATCAALGLAAGRLMPLEKQATPEPSIAVWVGSGCEGEPMRVAATPGELLMYGCHDTWTTRLTQRQVQGVAP